MSETPTVDYGSNPSRYDNAKASGLGIASLVLGILAVVFAFTGCLWIFAILLGLVGLVLGIVGWVTASGDPRVKPGTAIAGTITSGVALVLVPIVIFVFFAALGTGLSAAGGRIANTVLVSTTEAQANALAASARREGVDQITIDQARATLDGVLDGLSTDADDIGLNEGKVEAAMKDYRATLEDAAGTSLDDVPQFEAPEIDVDGDLQAPAVPDDE